LSNVRVTVRRATTTDAPAILACLAASFEPYRSSYTSDAFTDTVLTSQKIQQRFTMMSIFVAENEAAEIVGTIACLAADATEGHLRGMAVLPDWQGRGIAERLLSLAEAELARRGCSRITLDTTETLQRAMKFYENHGYRRSGKVTDFFGMPLHEYVKHLTC
jgi:ribosomal protein S18 acetylase RimI-like enzyme